MSEISLNASMRSNLLSLQQISKLQDRTQLRLSTGLKVNSAIDNPSSYYTASALNNRADDLSALLDSMGQGIQTIKAANEGIEKAEDLITQMKAVAEQVNGSSSSEIPDKEYFIELVGENGAVVSTADELRDAVNSGKETICVYGNIDLGDISTDGGLQLQENQKLVGVNYFGNFSNTIGESSITATSSANKNMVEISKTNCLISDLSLICTDSATAISLNSENSITEIKNIQINSESGGIIGAKGTLNLKEKINIKTKDYGIEGKTVNLESGSYVSIMTTSLGAIGISTTECNIKEESNLYISTQGKWAQTITGDIINISGNVELVSKTTTFAGDIDAYSELNIYASAKCKFSSNLFGFTGKLNIAQNAHLANLSQWYILDTEYSGNGTTDFVGTLNLSETSAWKTPTEIIEENKNENQSNTVSSTFAETGTLYSYQKQFNSALSQYDSLIKDSSYKGVNLLQEDKLKVNFNEDKTSHLLVQGVDMSSDALGLLAADWQTSKDVQNSLEQVLSVKDKLRSAASKLGNYYSIITERQTFTENLINVLQEGADKLTLADMNEESANMLSLQTQQSLAINSLSLASQAAQGVLRLF